VGYPDVKRSDASGAHALERRINAKGSGVRSAFASTRNPSDDRQAIRGKNTPEEASGRYKGARLLRECTVSLPGRTSRRLLHIHAT